MKNKLSVTNWQQTQSRMIAGIATEYGLTEAQATWFTYGEQLAANSMASYDTFMIDHELPEDADEDMMRRGFLSFSAGMYEALNV